MKTIFLVDDDGPLREALAEALLEDGHRVVQCQNGAEALGRLRKGERPDLILLDLMMPVMDGWQFREAQLGDERLADIPVIVITAAGGRLKPIEAGQILHKPFPIDDLYRAVEAC